MTAPRRKRARAAGTDRPRVSLDTGVLLRALLLSDDKAKRLRQAWQQGSCLPLIAASTAQALMRALAFPGLKLSEAQQHELLADFLPYAEVVAEATPRSRSQAAPALLLAASAAARVDCLVSDCAALRASYGRAVSRSEKRPCRLLSSDEFLASL